MTKWGTGLILLEHGHKRREDATGTQGNSLSTRGSLDKGCAIDMAQQEKDKKSHVIRRECLRRGLAG